MAESLELIPLLSSRFPLSFPFPEEEGRRVFQVSVDLRFNGYKIAPVDVNLYPSGWHNLCPHLRDLARDAIKEWLRFRGLAPSRVLLMAEPLDRNPAYIENLYHLKEILASMEMEVRVAILDERVPREGVLLRGLAHAVQVEGIEPSSLSLTTRSGFTPQWVVNENDFMSEPPPWLLHTTVPVDNPPHWGWFRRRKDRFFQVYARAIPRIAHDTGLDPWHFTILTRLVAPVDLSRGEGVERLYEEASLLYEELLREYGSRKIPLKPYLILKDNQGTFGRGVVALRDPGLLRNPPRWLRQKLSMGKGNRPIRELLLQEGIETRERIEGKTAEFVGMAIGARWIGGFFRLHREKGGDEPLNVPGTEFLPFCPEEGGRTMADPQRIELYRFFTRVAAWAAGEEVKEYLLEERAQGV